MNDILPDAVATWQFIEANAHRIFKNFGYNEIRVPVVEKTELFCRSIGETTDIVEKEMYTFKDRSDNSLTLRPEGTAPVMRSLIQHKLYNLDPIQKLYYFGPMFRYERPQKGRYRQFHQIGAEVIGVDDPKIDAQVLAMLSHFFKEIGIDDVELQINSLGCPECRPAYRDQLIAFLEKKLDTLCEDCQRRYTTNPLRALDCKSAGCQEATQDAPDMIDHLCTGCKEHFGAVRRHLDDIEVSYAINPRMVRGLDYYTKTTFEMITGSLGSQNAVAAGGRYDGLIKELGGPELPGIGFAIGVERLALLLQNSDTVATDKPQLFIAALGDQAVDACFHILTDLQRADIRAEMDYSGRSLKSQMKRADKIMAKYTLIIGEDELRQGKALLRNMNDSSQQEINLDNITSTLTDLLSEQD
jgi:histidyl-tRNA synthetase